ncbi:hypothetical protein Dsin_020388 [Dipteronia sinensis]|uniref:SHSP domain-containing protein n=1 Tax=Dipteronia sinensis TaxID=43782 RepID=A0AAE0A944_9ROSI|nr:hypothetical protein Dsin_020388 [Dipteronia sinensis]
MDSGSHADDHPEMKPATVFKGSATEACTETPMGLVDIEAMEEASRAADDHHPELRPPDIGVISKDAKSEGISRTAPPMGLIGVGVNESSYHFRVSLPGIPNTTQSNLKCEIGSDGTVCIQGVPVTTDSAAMQYSSDGHRMIFQQLSSPGPITVSFTLPGPVDPHMAELAFCPDGILEAGKRKSEGMDSGSQAVDHPEMKPAAVFKRSATEACMGTPTDVVDIEAMDEGIHDADDHYPELKPSDVGVISKDGKFLGIDDGSHVSAEVSRHWSCMGTPKELALAMPPMGLVGIGVSEEAFIFRVSLLGIQNTRRYLRCKIRLDGTVHIKGVVVTTDAAMKYSSIRHQMIFWQLSPGPFTVTFTLPGHVDPHLAKLVYRPDGILEVVVMKFK